VSYEAYRYAGEKQVIVSHLFSLAISGSCYLIQNPEQCISNKKRTEKGKKNKTSIHPEQSIMYRHVWSKQEASIQL
jgi:hypothetical protein